MQGLSAGWKLSRPGQAGGLEVAVSMDWGVNSFCQTEAELRHGE